MEEVVRHRIFEGQVKNGPSQISNYPTLLERFNDLDRTTQKLILLLEFPIGKHTRRKKHPFEGYFAVIQIYIKFLEAFHAANYFSLIAPICNLMEIRPLKWLDSTMRQVIVLDEKFVELEKAANIALLEARLYKRTTKTPEFDARILMEQEALSKLLKDISSGCEHVRSIIEK